MTESSVQIHDILGVGKARDITGAPRIGLRVRLLVIIGAIEEQADIQDLGTRRRRRRQTLCGCLFTRLQAFVGNLLLLASALRHHLAEFQGQMPLVRKCRGDLRGAAVCQDFGHDFFDPSRF